MTRSPWLATLEVAHIGTNHQRSNHASQTELPHTPAGGGRCRGGDQRSTDRFSRFHYAAVLRPDRFGKRVRIPRQRGDQRHSWADGFPTLWERRSPARWLRRLRLSRRWWLSRRWRRRPPVGAILCRETRDREPLCSNAQRFLHDRTARLHVGRQSTNGIAADSDVP